MADNLRGDVKGDIPVYFYVLAGVLCASIIGLLVYRLLFAADNSGGSAKIARLTVAEVVNWFNANRPNAARTEVEPFLLRQPEEQGRIVQGFFRKGTKEIFFVRAISYCDLDPELAEMFGDQDLILFQ